MVKGVNRGEGTLEHPLNLKERASMAPIRVEPRDKRNAEVSSL